MERNGRDSARVLRSRLDVNAWIASHPSVEQVRPPAAPRAAPRRDPQMAYPENLLRRMGLPVRRDALRALASDGTSSR